MQFTLPFWSYSCDTGVRMGTEIKGIELRVHTNIGQSIFDKGTRTIQQEKNSPFNKW
jgi:hypothetical protein